MKKIIKLSMAIAVLLTLFVGCLKNSGNTGATGASESSTANKDAIVIKVSNGASETNPTVIAEREVFKKQIEEKTNGRYIIDIYHSAQLGDDVKSTEGVRDGSIEMVFTSPAPLVGFYEDLAILDIPFLFSSEAVASEVLDGEVGDYLSAGIEKYGLVNLAWPEYGSRVLSNSVKDVHGPDDLEGLKIRTMDNKYHLATWDLFGSNPTPMSFGELFTALQSKTVDGQENPITTIYTSRFFEVNKYVTLTGHIYGPLMAIINKDLWDSMSAEDQKIFRDAAYDTAVRSREINRAEESNYIKEMEAEGVTVTVLTDEERDQYRELITPVWDMVEERVGPELIQMLRESIAEAEVQ